MVSNEAIVLLLRDKEVVYYCARGLLHETGLSIVRNADLVCHKLQPHSADSYFLQAKWEKVTLI